MHIFQIETIAESPPGFIENLCPLLWIVYRGNHVVEVYFLVQRSFVAREITYIQVAAFVEDGFFVSFGYAHVGSFGHDFFFLFSQVEYFGVAGVGIPYFFSVGIKLIIIACRKRKFEQASGQSFGIDSYSGCLTGFVIRFIFFGCGFVSGSIIFDADFFVRWQERRWGIFGE